MAAASASASAVKRLFSPQSTAVGWIGTGVMGKSMVGHLLNAGFKCHVYSRTLEKALPLQEKGAIIHSTPAAVASQSDVVFTMVGLPSDVRQVILGDDGVLNNMKPSGVIVDMTTSEPSLAREIYELAKTKQVDSVDAPVSGGDIGARNATLSIMCGGEEHVVEELKELFKFLGTARYMGAAGSGQHTKMTNQILISTMMIGACEGLLYASRAGLDLNQVIAAVGSGAAGSWTINNLGPRIVNRNFEPGFFVEHFIKDLGIALDESKKMGLSLPGLALANQLYLAVQAQGFGKKGTHALALALETLNGIQHQQPKP